MLSNTGATTWSPGNSHDVHGNMQEGVVSAGTSETFPTPFAQQNAYRGGDGFYYDSNGLSGGYFPGTAASILGGGGLDYSADGDEDPYDQDIENDFGNFFGLLGAWFGGVGGGGAGLGGGLAMGGLPAIVTTPEGAIAGAAAGGAGGYLLGRAIGRGFNYASRKIDDLIRQAKQANNQEQTKCPGGGGSKGFNKNEESIAAYLRRLGRTVSKNPREGMTGAGRQGDEFVDGVLHEFKNVDPGATPSTIKNVVNNSIRRGGQARNIIFDARGSGLSLSDAQWGVRKAFGISRGMVDNITVIGDNYFWSSGP